MHTSLTDTDMLMEVEGVPVAWEAEGEVEKVAEVVAWEAVALTEMDTVAWLTDADSEMDGDDVAWLAVGDRERDTVMEGEDVAWDGVIEVVAEAACVGEGLWASAGRDNQPRARSMASVSAGRGVGEYLRGISRDSSGCEGGQVCSWNDGLDADNVSTGNQKITQANESTAHTL